MAFELPGLCLRGSQNPISKMNFFACFFSKQHNIVLWDYVYRGDSKVKKVFKNSQLVFGLETTCVLWNISEYLALMCLHPALSGEGPFPMTVLTVGLCQPLPPHRKTA